MRWLTVRVPGQLGRDILLEKPGSPAMDYGTARQVCGLVDQPYGLDIGLHDPFGNDIRIVQLKVAA